MAEDGCDSGGAIVALRQLSCGEVLFSVDVVVLRLGEFLAHRPEDLLCVGVACRAGKSCGLAQSSELWRKLLKLWFPRASTEDPDAAMAARETRERQKIDDQEIVKQLWTNIGEGVPVDFATLYSVATSSSAGGSEMHPQDIMQLLAKHSQSFKQERCPEVTGAPLFCISPGPADAERWEALNPYQDAVSLLRKGSVDKLPISPSPAAPPIGPSESAVRELDPRAAFRLFHTGLLAENLSQDRSRKGGKGRGHGTAMRSWEYLA